MAHKVLKWVPVTEAVADVMARYQGLVEKNDKRREVAFDMHGLMGVWGEVLDEAAELGYLVGDDDPEVAPFVAALVEAAKKYQAELRETFA